MKRYLFYIIIMTMALSVAGYSAFAQSEEAEYSAKKESAQDPAAEQAPAASPAPAASAPAAASVKEEAPKPAELSIYGEVQNINVQANSFTVQYYDYDNDEEKSTEITLDSNSKLENAKTIGDIKKGDWVDITYTASAGQNIAKVVSVEKEEPAEEEIAPAIED